MKSSHRKTSQLTSLVASTIPHSDQRYDTVGDWDVAGSSIEVNVSDMEDGDNFFLVAIHEFIEAYLCLKRGIKEEDVTKFDKNFEEERTKGKHPSDAEPGDSKKAPYHQEHVFATKIEREIAKELGVDWIAYDEAINNL